MSLSTLLTAWQTDPSIASNIAAWRTFPLRPAQFAPFPDDLHPALVDALRSRGIGALIIWYLLQDEAKQACGYDRPT